MSDSTRGRRSNSKAVLPKALPLTRAEAETLAAAVQRIIQASETAAPVPMPTPKKKPRR
jgi:hypothetical protein